MSFELAGKAKERTAQVVSNRAYFAETATDTDAFIHATPSGAELGMQLRSEESPERFTLDFDLPAGATMRRAKSKKPIRNDPPQAIEIIRKGKPIVYVNPPIAHDADGQGVVTRMTIDGDRISLSVDHDGKDLMYPLFVDPEVTTFDDGRYNWQGWIWGQTHYRGSDGSYSSGGFGSAKNDCAYFCGGLYQSHPTNTYITNGSYANWIYVAPPSTHIYRFIPAGMHHEPLALFDKNHTYWFNGIMRQNYAGWESPVNHVNQGNGLAGNPFGPSNAATYGFTHDFCQLYSNGARCNTRPSASQAPDQNIEAGWVPRRP